MKQMKNIRRRLDLYEKGLSLIIAYMFFYSERPKTLAERKFEDDVPLAIKKSKTSNEVIEASKKNILF